MDRMRPTWLWSDRALLLLGMSFTVGAVGYPAVRCWTLWRASRSWWDLFDSVSYGAFGLVAAAVAVAMETYDSPLLFTLGALVVGIGCVGAHRFFGDTFTISGPR